MAMAFKHFVETVQKPPVLEWFDVKTPVVSTLEQGVSLSPAATVAGTIKQTSASTHKTSFNTYQRQRWPPTFLKFYSYAWTLPT